MAKIIKAPQSYDGEKNTLFLAGSISNTRNWQDDMTDLLGDSDITILNPRRDDFDTDDEDAIIEQIKWEYKALRYADRISFWFSHETVAPITLYELGTWTDKDTPLFIGIDPKYERKEDILIQTLLVKPDFEFVYSIEDLANQVLKDL